MERVVARAVIFKSMVIQSCFDAQKLVFLLDVLPFPRGYFRLHVCFCFCGSKKLDHQNFGLALSMQLQNLEDFVSNPSKSCRF